MTHQAELDSRLPLVTVVGSDAARRASLCRTAGTEFFHIEPLERLGELRAADFTKADVFLVWNDRDLLDQLISQMTILGQWVPVVVFSEAASPLEVVAALEAGAVHFLQIPCEKALLVETLEAAIGKRRTLLPRWQRAAQAKNRLNALSLRERQVVTAVANGMSNRIAARELGISPRTVEVHRCNAYRKLEVQSTGEAIRLMLDSNFEYVT